METCSCRPRRYLSGVRQWNVNVCDGVVDGGGGDMATGRGNVCVKTRRLLKVLAWWHLVSLWWSRGDDGVVVLATLPCHFVVRLSEKRPVVFSRTDHSLNKNLENTL